MSCKLSIITINYNNLEGLKKTFKSVFEQSFSDFEYIVIDGGSNDGSKEFIQQNATPINYWVSEKDKGVYHAMNKGIQVATGTYLLFLNSGDWLNHSEILSKATSFFKDEFAIIYGNLIIQKSINKHVLWQLPEKLDLLYFINDSLPHPGSFIKKELFEKYFYYNEDFKIVSDWEFFIYTIIVKKETYLHLPFVISYFDHSGISSVGANNHLIDQERQVVFEKYFSDYIHEINFIRKIKTKRYQQLKNCSENKLLWSLIKILLNISEWFTPKEKRHQLFVKQNNQSLHQQ